MEKLLPLIVPVLAILLRAAFPSGNRSQGLSGKVWMLSELKGNTPLPGTSLTADFTTDGRLSGSSGCNRYSGSYTLAGQKIRMGPFISTLMACPGPVMDQEALYLEALGTASAYRVDGGRLALLDSDGTPLAVFVRVDQSIQGSRWNVLSYNNGREAVVSLLAGSEITARFGEDGRLTGNAGCNDYFASYETVGESISIGTAGSTRKFCADPEGLMEQERLYLAALQTASTYKVTGIRMEMRTTGGALVAVFARAQSR